jgi:hypothetical protein
MYNHSMMTIKSKSLKTAGKVILSLVLLVYTQSASAINLADSDLSRLDGTFKSILSAFWFFVCVGFLIAAAIIGSRNKFSKIRRDYKGPENKY